MPCESPQSEFCGKSYGCFTKTAQDRANLCTVAIKPNFQSRVVVIGFYTANESVVGFLKLFILGF